MKRGPRPRTEPTERERSMAADYRAGKTLAEIGDAHGITRERVRQIITERFGMTAKSGGQSVQSNRSRIKRAAAKDAKYLKTKGCSFAQYQELRAMFKPTRAYSCQFANAEKRGIPWEMNLWQWWTIWQESGHWDQRGRGNGYMMCRKGDAGPYSPDNVFIERGIVNSSEGQSKRRKHSLPMGVRPSKTPGWFVARRQVGGKKIVLGTFATPEAAHVAYLAADPFRVAA